MFTLPAELRSLALRNRRLVFELLMKAAADSLLELGRDPKWLGAPAQLGITAVLHTWTPKLAFHPHVHCIVTGGGLLTMAVVGSRRPANSCSLSASSAPSFAATCSTGSLALGATVSSDSLPRTKAAPQLVALMPCTAPRGSFTPNGPEQVYRYLGRYTHRVAISNSRLVSATDETVTFAAAASRPQRYHHSSF